MRLIFTYRPYNPFSWLVRKLTSQRYSHVAIQMSDGLVYEAVLGGCRRRPLHDFLKHNHVEAVVYTEAATPLMHSRAVSKLGSAYDVPALLWFLFYLWATKKGWEVPRLTINPKWLLCSEYIYYIMTGDTQTVTPEDVYKMAENTP